jgi:CheY-like chemotaxis protein
VVIKTARSEERLLDEASLFLHRMVDKLPKQKQAMIGKLYDNQLAFKDKTILLVDDDIRNVISMSQVLSEHGVKAVIAENGKHEIEMLSDNPDVSLILIDMMMPIMDGYEAMAEIPKNEEHKQLPIIALTAKVMAEDRQK